MSLFGHSFFSWLRRIGSGPNETRSRVEQLEHEIAKLKKLEELLQSHRLPADVSGESGQPPFVYVEHVHLDKLIVEKLELNNNLGQLGIKELTGRLNIGTTYSHIFPDSKEGAGEARDAEREAVPASAAKRNAASVSPKVRIRRRG